MTYWQLEIELSSSYIQIIIHYLGDGGIPNRIIMANKSLKLKRNFEWVARNSELTEIISQTKNFFTCEQEVIEYLDSNRDKEVKLFQVMVKYTKKTVEIEGQLVQVSIPKIEDEKLIEIISVKKNDLDVEYISAEMVE